MPDEKKLAITFRKAPDYKIIPATGAWGGPTPNGEIFMNLMVEHGAFPNLQTFRVDEAGKIDVQNVLESIAAGDAERELLVGVVMTPGTARSIAEWLRRNADRIEPIEGS